MNILDRLWDGICTYFGLRSITLCDREVSAGVRAVSTQDGGLLYRVSIADDWTIQNLADRLDDRLQQYLCRQEMAVSVLEETIFFQLLGTSGPSASLVLSEDRGWELFVPPNLLKEPSNEEAERRWDEFAILVHVSSLQYKVL